MIYSKQIIKQCIEKNPNEPEYVQAVSEVINSLAFIVDNDDKYRKYSILERLIEPERIIIFRVVWKDDNNNIHVNKGYRIQHSNILGPYKGGLRFHPSVNLSVLKFLAFEQTFKNSLTQLTLGGAKGGSDFDPKGKSDNEIMNFCQAYMNELYRHIGPNKDVPAGDIGVGAKEIGYLFGQYKKIKGDYETGVLTGKDISYGGSLIRKEATGYGLLYFVNEILSSQTKDIKDKKILISGSGNVALYAIEKAQQLGAKVISASDSNGYIIDENGINLEILKNIKEINKLRIKEYIKYVPSACYYEGNVFNHNIDFDIALPCATQNEISIKEAQNIINHKCFLVAEGSNMPVDNAALKLLKENKIIHAPGKASNAGGVAVSGLEMAQNSMRISWTREEVDKKLKEIMQNIHNSCVNTCKQFNKEYYDYDFGANVSAFLRLSNAIISQGIV